MITTLTALSQLDLNQNHKSHTYYDTHRTKKQKNVYAHIWAKKEKVRQQNTYLKALGAR